MNASSITQLDPRPVVHIVIPPYEMEINLCFQLRAFIGYIEPFTPAHLRESWCNAAEDVEDLLTRLEDMKQKAA